MKRFALIAGVALAILLVAAAILPFLIDPNDYRPTLEAALTAAIGRDVRIGNLKLAILSGGVTAGDLSIAENPAYGKTPFVQAKSLRIGVELWPLITSRKLNVTGVTIDRPEIRLIQAPSGDWNFDGLGVKPAAKPGGAEPTPSHGLDLSVKLVQVNGGRLSVGRTSGRSKPLMLDPVNLEVRDFSPTASFPFKLSAKVAGGGDIQLNGNAGPIGQGNIEATPFNAALKIAGFDLAGSGWTQATPGMAGIVGLDGSAESDGSKTQVRGKLKCEKLKLAQNGKPAGRAIELDIGIDHNLKTRAGRLSRGDIHIGAAKATLTGTYASQGEATLLHLTLSGLGMPVPELAATLPALGVALPAGSSLQGGTADVKLTIEGPSTNLVTTGAITVRDTTISGFDLGRKMQVIQALAGIGSGPNTTIRTLSTNIRMSNGGIAADSMELIVPAIGELRGAGVISPSNALDFKMTALVHSSRLMAAIEDKPIPFLVGGTASDPSFRPDVRAVVSEQAKSVGVKAVEGLLKRFGGKQK